MVNSAIDFYRKHKKHQVVDTIENATIMENFDDNIIDRLSEQEILKAVQALSPAYKLVFNLYVLEGFNHNEIAQKLGISTGASKSNLSKARAKLKTIITTLNPEEHYGKF